MCVAISVSASSAFSIGNAANEGRNFAGNFIESAEHDVLARGFHSRALQNIAQSWTGKRAVPTAPLPH